MSLLIITAAIEIRRNDIYSLNIKDTDVRLQQYLDALTYALKNYKNISAVIFCDNTNYIYDYSDVNKLAEENNKKLEILSFLGDVQSVVDCGKGYGEGEILQYIFKNSELLCKYESFCKLTGRLIVKNFNEINLHNGDNRFIYHSGKMYGTEYSYVSTVFYKINRNTYLKYFINAHQNVKDMEKKYLEVIFFQVLINNSIESRSFNTFPVISGYSGSTGDQYDLSDIKLFMEKTFNFLGLHNVQSNTFKNMIINCITFVKNTVK